MDLFSIGAMDAGLWVQYIAIFFVLVALEGLLSADNALVLAVMVRPLSPKLRSKALFYGLIGAVVLRFTALFFVSFLANVWQAQAACALYLIYVGTHNLYKYIKEKTMFDFSEVKNYDPELAEAMENELTRQRTNLELIASENLVSKAVMAAMGSHLTNKYAEGYPGKRYYGGCQYVDVVEDLARERAKELFGCEYVNVQPHSGAQANMAVFFAVLYVGDTYMVMSLVHGGHLTHGSPVNMSGKNYHCVPYGVNDEGFIDYDEVERIALECKPKMIIAGASAYAREINFKRFREIAD